MVLCVTVSGQTQTQAKPGFSCINRVAAAPKVVEEMSGMRRAGDDVTRLLHLCVPQTVVGATGQITNQQLAAVLPVVDNWKNMLKNVSSATTTELHTILRNIYADNAIVALLAKAANRLHIGLQSGTNRPLTNKWNQLINHLSVDVPACFKSLQIEMDPLSTAQTLSNAITLEIAKIEIDKIATTQFLAAFLCKIYYDYTSLAIHMAPVVQLAAVS
jgi:hypothetical protein